MQFAGNFFASHLQLFISSVLYRSVSSYVNSVASLIKPPLIARIVSKNVNIAVIISVICCS